MALLQSVSILSLFYILRAALVCASGLAYQSVGVSSVKACQELKRIIPAGVHFPGSSEYLEDIDHWEAAAVWNSTCSIAPQTIEEVQTAVQIIGRSDIRSPFAIKSGGHTFNPGFSSTLGVQLSLHNLRELSYNPSDQTVKLGSGWTWDEVYAKLQPENVTVIGGRIPGVGMGVLYGGGLSWYTNQHGLASDNAIAFDLVLPNGTYVNVTQETQPDLYFGLRGGLNNFGIITATTVKTWPTGEVWGGTIAYSMDYNEEILHAIEEFSVNNTDVKAPLQAAYTVTGEKTFWQILTFYDAPDANPDPFKLFLSIPSISSSAKITTHSQLVKDTPFPAVPGSYLHTVPIIHYTIPVLRSVQASIDAAFAQARADNRPAETFLWFAEPFYQHYTHETYPSAFPHSASNPTTPSCFGFNYNSTSLSDQAYFRELILQAAHQVQETVVKEGEGKWDDVKYPNYAVKGISVKEVFGESLGRMRKVKAVVDPDNLMTLQSDGFFV